MHLYQSDTLSRASDRAPGLRAETTPRARAQVGCRAKGAARRFSSAAAANTCGSRRVLMRIVTAQGIPSDRNIPNNPAILSLGPMSSDAFSEIQNFKLHLRKTFTCCMYSSRRGAGRTAAHRWSGFPTSMVTAESRATAQSSGSTTSCPGYLRGQYPTFVRASDNIWRENRPSRTIYRMVITF